MKLYFTILLSAFILKGYAQLPGYDFAKQISIESSEVSGSSDLSDFTVLISFTDPDLRTAINGGNVENTNGYDIAFTTDDCVTQLPHEIEKYDALTGEYLAWVKIPSLSATLNTELHMFYGNSSISADPSTETTWDAHSQAVWHMNTDNDATINDNDLTNNGTTVGPGFLGEGKMFDGTDDYLEFDSLGIMEPVTFSLWINAADLNQDRRILGQMSGSSNQSGALAIRNSSISQWSGSNWNELIDLDTSWAGSWHHLAIVYNSATYTTAYWDGVNQGFTSTNGFDFFDVNGGLGQKFISQYGLVFNGTFDEVKISDTARSPEWIDTEYNNQSSPSTFYSVSAEMDAETLCNVTSNDLLSAEENRLQIYPNPATNQVVIKTSAKIETVKLYNLNGQELVSFNSNSFNVEHLANGIYMVKVYADGMSYVQRLVKQ